MLSPDWNRIRRALQVMGVFMVLSALFGGLAAFSATLRLGMSEVTLVLVAQAACSVVVTASTLVFASIPRDSHAQTAGVVAAIFSLGELTMRLSPFALAGFSGMALLVAPVLGLVAVLALLKAIGKIGLYLREDRIYERATALGVLIGLLVGAGLLAALATCLSPAVAAIAQMAIAAVALFVPFFYVALIFRTASALGRMLP